MKLRIRRDILLETICVEYLLVMGLVSNYIGFSVVWKGLLLILISALLLNRKCYRKEFLLFFVRRASFWLVALLGLSSILHAQNNQYLFFNFKVWMIVACIVLVIDLLRNNEKVGLRFILKSNFGFLNFFWLINLTVLSIQCTGNGFMIKSEWLASNSFYEDQCAGLFGNSGTHRLCFYSIFMMVYNLSVADETEEWKKRKEIILFTMITEFWMIALSIYNDNKTLFLLLPLFLLLYYLWRDQANRQNVITLLKKICRISYVGIIISVCVGILLICSPGVFNFIEENVIQLVQKVIVYAQTGSGNPTERLTIATDALNYGRGLVFGDGLGAAAVSEINGTYRGYKHFGISSIGSVITLGGVWFYLVLCLFYTRCLLRLLGNRRNTYLDWLLCFVTLVILTIYTMLFENTIVMLWLCLIFVMFGKETDSNSFVKVITKVSEKGGN